MAPMARLVSLAMAVTLVALGISAISAAHMRYLALLPFSAAGTHVTSSAIYLPYQSRSTAKTTASRPTPISSGTEAHRLPSFQFASAISDPSLTSGVETVLITASLLLSIGFIGLLTWKSSKTTPSGATQGPKATSELIEFYDSWSAGYGNLTEGVDWKIPDWIRSKLKYFKAGTEVLDLGCADGLVGRVVREEVRDIRFTGVDVSKAMVKRCRASGYKAACVADLNKGLPRLVKSQLYDMVTAIGCLEFISDHPALLREISQVMHPGGYLLATFEVKAQDQTNITELMGVKKTIHDAAEVAPMLQDAGFTVVDQKLEPAAYIFDDEDDSKTPVPYLLVVAQLQPKTSNLAMGIASA